jgi:regulator of replication initiation timing
MVQQNKHFTPPASLPACAVTSLNSLTHGAAAETLFLPDEDPSIFYSNLDDAYAHYQPGTAEESDLVAHSVHARWFLARRLRVHSHYEFELHKRFPDETYWPDESLHRLNLFDRYKTNAERALRRALTNVQAIRKDAERSQKSQELLALKKQNLAMELEKWEHTRKLKDAKDAREERSMPPPRPPRENIEDLFKEVEDFMAPIQNRPEHGGAVIVQHSYVSLDRGATYIDAITPTNGKVLQMICQADSYAEPPQRVVRHFNFADGIPLEYNFLLDDGFPRPINPNCSIVTSMTFEEWEELAAREDRMMKHQPKDAEVIEDEDIEDEDEDTE